jgi:hypothetical protein
MRGVALLLRIREPHKNSWLSKPDSRTRILHDLDIMEIPGSNRADDTH